METSLIGCCGKVKQIVKGTVGHVAETRLKIKTKKSPHTEARLQKCRACEFGTWMKIKEYAAWLLENGIKVLRNFSDLEKLPKLPKQNTGKNLYCRICKCYIPGKARIDDEKCPKGFWKN